MKNIMKIEEPAKSIKPYDELPDAVKRHVTIDPTTGELILWDETEAYEVCRSNDPASIMQALYDYVETLN